MKIAFPIIGSGTGSEVYYKLLQKILIENGHFAELIILPYRYEFIPGLSIHLKGYLSKFDIIHTNADYGSLFKIKNKPLIVTHHHDVFDHNFTQYSSFPQKVYYWTLLKKRIKKSFKLAEAVIMPSQYTFKQTLITYKSALKNPKVISNGIDHTVFKIDKTQRIKGKLLFVGSPSRRKGFHLLPEIMKKIEDQGYFLICVCDKPNSLEDVKNITYTGKLPLEQLIIQYRQAESLIFPSRLEGFGYSVLEAASCGCSVVCSNSSSLPEVLNDYNKVIFVDEFNSDSYIEAINRICLLSDPPETKKLVRNFNLNLMGIKYINLYEDVLLKISSKEFSSY